MFFKNTKQKKNVVSAHTAQIFRLKNLPVACTTDFHLTFLHSLQINTQVHSHWLCVANRLWPSHQAGERVTVAREETDSTCERASLCARERWRGDEKTKWEEETAQKKEGSGDWRENVGEGELFFAKGHRWRLLGSDAVWIKHVRPPVYVKEAGRIIIDWLNCRRAKKKKTDTHMKLVKSGGGSHGKAWPHALGVGWATSERVSECCCLCKWWGLLWWINGRFSSVQCVAGAMMFSPH